jgi:hypothetical protein
MLLTHSLSRNHPNAMWVFQKGYGKDSETAVRSSQVIQDKMFHERENRKQQRESLRIAFMFMGYRMFSFGGKLDLPDSGML